MTWSTTPSPATPPTSLLSVPFHGSGVRWLVRCCPHRDRGTQNLGQPDCESSESETSSEDSSSSDSSESTEEQARSSSQSNISVGQSNISVGQSNLHESSSTNKKRKEPIKGILKSKTLKPNVTGQSNFSVGQSNFAAGQSNSEKTILSNFRANENAGILDVAENDNLLDDEKISHLKEQIMMWKYRTTCAKERVTRLLQFRERNVKNAYDESINKEATGKDGIESFANRGGTRSRLSDTLDLLT